MSESVRRRHPLTPEQLKVKIQQIKPLMRAYDLLDVHIHITDQNGVVLWGNRKCEEITGFSKSEMAGRNAGDLWGGQQPREFYQKMWHTIKDLGQPFRATVKNHTKDGQELIQDMRITPIYGPMDEVEFYVSVQIEKP